VIEDLTERQREILLGVVEEYVTTGQPVGSHRLVGSTGLRVSASTVRSELAELERRGLLTHPHTSAGRVPTERAYRFYVNGILEQLERRPGPFPIDLPAVRGEVESTLQATTEVLSDLTRLLALVSAPPVEPATVRHVEVLLLQEHVVMVVVITSTGAVSKRVLRFEEPVDSGLANWAGQYLNEEVAGLRLGTHHLRRRFQRPDLGARERGFLELLRPAFTELLREDQRLFVGGTASLLAGLPAEELGAYRRLLEALEKRVALLGILSEALDRNRPFVRVGEELEHPALASLALVGAPYGLASQPLGAVSLLGPIRMDYEKAIRSVHAAASELSRFAEDYYADN
jgi:heat-inducible transcriptional repressor